LNKDRIKVRTYCLRCGAQIEVDQKKYKGKDLFSETLLKKEDLHSDDLYTYVHLLCEKCDMMKGFQEEADKDNK
jgi:hypothetical protein